MTAPPTPAADAAPGAEDGATAADELDRQPYLRRALDALERGQLDVPGYVQLVRAINAAGSTHLMEALVAEAVGAPRAAPLTTARALDPVDLAVMGRQQTASSSVNGRRYLTLAVVLVLFAVLLGVGVYLASHVHTITSGVQHLATGAVPGAPPGGRLRPY